MKRFAKNAVICYKGGGYDGCYMEYNYAFISENGEFHDLFSSGDRGCKTLQALKKSKYADPEVYDISTEEGKKALVEIISYRHIVAVSVALEVLGILLKMSCDTCSKVGDIVDMYPCGETGGGGVTIIPSAMVCSDCFCSDADATVDFLETPYFALSPKKTSVGTVELTVLQKEAPIGGAYPRIKRHSNFKLAELNYYSQDGISCMAEVVNYGALFTISPDMYKLLFSFVSSYLHQGSLDDSKLALAPENIREFIIGSFNLLSKFEILKTDMYVA